MANNACTACTDIRTVDPALVARGFTDSECTSLKNDTGLVPTSGNNNCTDLENLADCLIGNLEQEVDEYDVCDWREFSKLTLANLWTMVKAIVCSDCGLWANIHNTNEIVESSVERIDEEIVQLEGKCPYLVGDLYITTKSQTPDTIWEGTEWTQIQNCQLVAAGSSYTVGQTYGNASHTHSTANHTLTTNEIPAHTHGSKTLRGEIWNIAGENSEYPSGSCNGIVSYHDTRVEYVGYATASTETHDGFVIDATHEHNSVGGNGAHNHGDTGSADNLFTSLAVNVWQRTA